MAGIRTPQPPSLALGPAVGARLARASVQWHVIPACPDSLMRFWLEFEGVGPFSFAVGEVREALKVVREPPERTADLGRYGRLEVRQPTPADPVSAALGKRLLAVEDIRCEGRPDVIAARLAFDGASLWVADLHEDLNWALGEFRSLGEVFDGLG